MTSSITQCPECATRFHISAAQLEAHQGMARCGRCHGVFNAAEYLHDDAPHPQLSLPIDEPMAVQVEQSPVPATLDFTEQTSNAPPAPATLAEQVEFVEELTDEVTLTSRKDRRWPWQLGSVFLLLLLTAQIAYFFRVEIAAELPATKPVLLQYCELLQCKIPLPKNAEQIRIESSDLQADSQQARLITLHALLHNNATYNQAYPELELTLLDLEEKVISRRVLHPKEYLKTSDEENLGIAANRDASIKLQLDTSDLKPSGYKLFLFYAS
jgi:predicted Zn finger-like uncharacterized protein